MKISRTSSIQNMLDAFNSRISQLSNEEEIVSSTVIATSSKMYSDVGGGFGGNDGQLYSERDLRSIWDRDHDDDPCMEEYSSYEAWMDDNINNGWLKEVDAGCHESTEEIDDNLEDVMGKNINCSFDVYTIDDDKLMDIIDKYNGTSYPVSGDWDTETAHEQQAIADAFGISLDDAKKVMICRLGFPEDDKFIDASTAITCHDYLDETGDAFGEPGVCYSEDDLRSYFEMNKSSDPVLQEYSTFEDWLTDTIDNTNLRFSYVDGGCHVESCDSLDTEVQASWDDDFIDSDESEWTELERKTVNDSDGFTTDYTLYRNNITGQYVTVFGDRDLYRPEDGVYDAEFDDENEAYEWFESYYGFD